MACSLPPIREEFVIAAIAPEANLDPSGFAAARRRAEQRLTKYENRR
jgi:hypothetical protein